MHDGISGALLMVRHLDADGVAEVVDRLVSSEGLEAVAAEIPRTPLPGDAFVSGVLATDVVELRRAVASCPQLTTDQIRRVLGHGGPDAEVAARLFPNRGKDAAFAPVRPLPSAAALQRPAAAEAALLDGRCPDDLAQEALARHPRLAYVLRNQHPDYVRFLRGDHRPVHGIAALDIVRIGVHDGGLRLADVVRDMRPAGAAVRALSSVVHGTPWLAGELRALLGPRLTRALGSGPGAWRELAEGMDAFAGSLEAFLDAVGETGVRESGQRAVAADRCVEEVGFLLAQLPIGQLADLLPELPGSMRELITARAAGGDLAGLTELAVATRDPHLLHGLARRRSLDPVTTARLAALDDRAVNHALAANPDVEHAVRHRIFCGFPARPGGERLPLDDGLRDFAQHAAPETLIACGDPELALRALTGRPKPRVADRIAAAVAVWERGGGELLGRIPAEAFGASVGRLVSAAVAADSAQGLYAAREREARKAARSSGAATASRRRRWDDPDSDWGRLSAAMTALDHGHLTPEQMIHDVAPARHTIGAFQGRVTYSARNPVDAALAGHVRTHMDGPDRGAAWAVLVRLLPDFEGTLAELLTVCSAVAA